MPSRRRTGNQRGVVDQVIDGLKTVIAAAGTVSGPAGEDWAAAAIRRARSGPENRRG